MAELYKELESAVKEFDEAREAAVHDMEVMTAPGFAGGGCMDVLERVLAAADRIDEIRHAMTRQRLLMRAVM